ncbi:MAG: hypothetical protein HY660_12250 [Armatimonadetes bacterium]|nr:hypothetical protein [Armatimonadota bacterium]
MTRFGLTRMLAAAAAVLAVSAALVATVSRAAPGQSAPGHSTARYEVWVIDQADAARGGARLYIYDGLRLEAGESPTPVVVNLDAAARGVGDGAGVRPHMVEFNSTLSHAVIANFASGHVYVMRTRDRKIVASIDVGEQAHHAVVSPDGRLILVANLGGKRLARIHADFAAGHFTYDRAQDLNLGALEDKARPDNAPVCPVLAGGKAYVTLRGGGMYVVDYRATPMRILRSYSRDEIAPAGCGGMVVGGRIYVNSGTIASSDLYVFDAASDALLRHLPLGWTGFDSHGMVAVGTAGRSGSGAPQPHGAGGRYLWLSNRAQGNVVIVDTQHDSVVGIIDGVGAAPDIAGVSPSGRRVYMVLRGPNNLSGGPSARGATPGFAILQVVEDGRRGRRVGFVPIGDQSPASPVDPHTLVVRVIR